MALQLVTDLISNVSKQQMNKIKNGIRKQWHEKKSMTDVLVCVWVSLAEGLPQVSLHRSATFFYSFHGSSCSWLLPQKRPANKVVRTAGCGVRPPRATGKQYHRSSHLITLCVFWVLQSVGGYAFSQLCRSDLGKLVERRVVFWFSFPFFFCGSDMQPLLSITVDEALWCSSSSSQSRWLLRRKDYSLVDEKSKCIPFLPEV